MKAAKVGILAADLLQQHRLKSALTDFGFEVVLNLDPSEKSIADVDLPGVHIWLVDIKDESDSSSQWLDLLLQGDTPVLMGVDNAPVKNSHDYPRWEKRVYTKLVELSPSVSQFEYDASLLETVDKDTQVSDKISLPARFSDRDFEQEEAQFIWVLGASLGGPEAVKAFLDVLPEGLPVAFVYAQHIDACFEKTLKHTIGRHSAYDMTCLRGHRRLRCGEVLIAPIESDFSIDDDGFYCSGKSWLGPYNPSIDQVVEKIAEAYPGRSGCILFSGMGNDGTEAILNLPDEYRAVWAQSPGDCASGSMPQHAIGTGRVAFIGSPQELAQHFVHTITRDWEPS